MCLRHDGATEPSNSTVDRDEGGLQLGCPLRIRGGRSANKLIYADRGRPVDGLRNVNIFVDAMNGIPRVRT